MISYKDTIGSCKDSDMALDWTNFQVGADARRAFEGFSSQLFESWCHRTCGTNVVRVVHVNGAGGDGGVEALCELADGSSIGLQAKWFRDPLGDGQITQIRRSIASASKKRPSVTRYFIAIPRNLADRALDNETSERDRWDALEGELRTTYPEIRCELWDEARLERELAHAEGSRRFWFQRNGLQLANLRTRFATQRTGWLAPRYCPDLHSMGKVEEDLATRASGTPPLDILNDAARLAADLKRCVEAIDRLSRYSEFRLVPDSSALQQGARAELEHAIAYASGVAAQGSARGGLVAAPLVPDAQVEALYALLGVLQEVVKGWSDTAPLTQTTELVDNAAREAARVVGLGLELQGLSRPALYIGRPGSGKTQALAHAVDQWLASDRPAVLIRAKDIDPQLGWDYILRIALGEPTWTVTDILDSLEAAASEAEVRSADKGLTDAYPAVKALFAVDGIDESAAVPAWAERLAELPKLLEGRPRLCFIATVRDTVERRLGKLAGWSRVYVHDSDAPIGRLFQTYVTAFRIDCPSSIRWALGSPLALRLFCEEFENSKVGTVSPRDLAIQRLIARKIERAEEEVANRAAGAGLGTWPAGLQVVLRASTALAEAYVQADRPLELPDLLRATNQALPTPGVLSAADVLWLLDRMEESGLALRSRRPGDGPLAADRVFWEPAYDVLADYLVALHQADLLVPQLGAGTQPPVPSVLRRRPNARLLCLSILSERGVDWFAGDLWAKHFTVREREADLLWCLRSLPKEGATHYEKWVAQKLTRSMPDCRDTLARLIIPSLRDAEVPYGARFVDETLKGLRTADRDLFWSGPNDIPASQGAPWEGHGPQAIEALDLALDDPWDGAPLLACWGLATVVEAERHRLRNQLAHWGHDHPVELVSLLRHMAASTNDPQVVEDLLTSAFGSVCMAAGPDEWAPLAAWIDQLAVGVEGKPFQDDAIMRHAMRGMAHRLLTLGLPVSSGVLDELSRPADVADRLLPIDVAAASSKSDHGTNLIKGDLAWYVVPKSFKPFLEGPGGSRAEGPGTAALGALIERHAANYGLASMSPFQFAAAAVAAHAKELGWDLETFYGKPNGGKPGEKLGADLAIGREHFHGTHGSRSPVASFGEKYVWTGTAIVSGYLADRVPAKLEDDWGSEIDPPVDVAYVYGMPANPASDLRLDDGNEDFAAKLVSWEGLSPPVAGLQAVEQFERSNEWVTKAPVPDPTSWIELGLPGTERFSDFEPWVILSAYAVREEEDSRGEGAVWISSLGVPVGDYDQIVHGGALDLDRMSEAEGSVSSWGTYADAAEAIWAPWIRDSYVERDLGVGDETIMARTTASKLVRNGPHGEESWRLPSDWLRKQLGLVRLDGKGLYWNREMPVAAFIKIGETAWRSPFSSVLIARKPDILAACAREGLMPIWGIKVFRTPTAVLSIKRQGEDHRARSEARFEWLGYIADGRLSLTAPVSASR